jgi:hypothetical protein
MVRMRQFDVEQFPYGDVAEPRELLERQKQLSLIEQEPEAMLRDVRDFNF